VDKKGENKKGENKKGVNRHFILEPNYIYINLENYRLKPNADDWTTSHWNCKQIFEDISCMAEY
jgi:hypothetical protein